MSSGQPLNPDRLMSPSARSPTPVRHKTLSTTQRVGEAARTHRRFRSPLKSTVQPPARRVDMYTPTATLCLSRRSRPLSCVHEAARFQSRALHLHRRRLGGTRDILSSLRLSKRSRRAALHLLPSSSQQLHNLRVRHDRAIRLVKRPCLALQALPCRQAQAKALVA